MVLTEGFKRTLDDALANAEWDRFDAVIVADTNDYNTRLSGSPGFVKLPRQ